MRRWVEEEEQRWKEKKLKCPVLGLNATDCLTLGHLLWFVCVGFFYKKECMYAWLDGQLGCGFIY